MECYCGSCFSPYADSEGKVFDLEPPRAVTSEDVEPAKGEGEIEGWNAMTDRAVYTDGRAIDQVASGGDGRLSAVTWRFMGSYKWGYK